MSLDIRFEAQRKLHIPYKKIIEESAALTLLKGGLSFPLCVVCLHRGPGGDGIHQ